MIEVYMIDETQIKDISEIYLMALCVWREAQNQPINVKWAVAWVIKNRANKPSWWGKDITSVITKPYQFSSFNANDPNSHKIPQLTDTSWLDSLRASRDVYYNKIADPTMGCTFYHDKSLDNNPPAWTSGKTPFILGDMRFYKG